MAGTSRASHTFRAGVFLGGSHLRCFQAFCCAAKAARPVVAGARPCASSSSAAVGPPLSRRGGASRCGAGAAAAGVPSGKLLGPCRNPSGKLLGPCRNIRCCVKSCCWRRCCPRYASYRACTCSSDSPSTTVGRTGGPSSSSCARFTSYRSNSAIRRILESISSSSSSPEPSASHESKTASHAGRSESGHTPSAIRPRVNSPRLTWPSRFLSIWAKRSTTLVKFIARAFLTRSSITTDEAL